jgi:hypothetical protein
VDQVVKGLQDGRRDVTIKMSRSQLPKPELMRAVALLENCRHPNIVEVW